MDERKGRPERANTPSVPRPSGRCATRRAQTTRFGLKQCSLKSPRSGCGTRRALRGFQNTPRSFALDVVVLAFAVNPPVDDARASKPESEVSLASCLSPSGVLCRRRVEASAESGEKRSGVSASFGGGFLWDTFICPPQRKVSRPRCENRNYCSSTVRGADTSRALRAQNLAFCFYGSSSLSFIEI